MVKVCVKEKEGGKGHKNTLKQKKIFFSLR